jgi:hypothetical protein
MLYEKFTRFKNLSMWLFCCLSRRSIELSILIRLSVHFVCPMCFVILLIGQGFASLFGIRDPSQSLWMRIDKRVETAKKKSRVPLHFSPVHPPNPLSSTKAWFTSLRQSLFACVFNDALSVCGTYCVDCAVNAEIF